MSFQTRYINLDEVAVIRAAALEFPSWSLSDRQTCDVELILNGAFFPLTGFMTEADANTVFESNTWQGHFFPVPIMLDVTAEFADQVTVGQDISLMDREGAHIAVLKLTEKFPLARIETYCDEVEICLAGEIWGVEAPVHHDFNHIRMSPEEVRNQFDKLGWCNVLGFDAQRPLHQKQVHEINQVARSREANLLIMPSVGVADTGDIHHYALMHCFEHVQNRFPTQSAALCMLPLVRRHSGIRDVLLHALVMQNYGCSHYLVDENICFVGATDPDDISLQETLLTFDERLDISLVQKDHMVYCAQRGGFIARREVKEQTTVQEFSRQALQEHLESGLDVPEWYTYPEIITELKKICKPRTEQGFTLFFTGLSGAGKSTIANIVLVRMMEMGGRPVTLLDGDIVRQMLSSELGFSKEHRDLNIRRIGYVASQLTRQGGIAICALIAPYREARRAVRSMVEDVGGFIEVHVATSIEECERRDRKGLYAKARAGIIKEFTGVSDPYEVPGNPELEVDTKDVTPEESAQEVMLVLEKLGYLKQAG